MTQSDKKEEKVREKETLKAEPVSPKEKKLSGKTAGKLKFYGVVAFLSLLCAGFIWFLFKPDAAETVEGAAGINTTIPDAIAPETMADKQKAYELEEMKKRRREKVRTLQDVAGDYLASDTSKVKPEAPKADAIRESRERQRQISRQITSFYQEPEESPKVAELERRVKELNERLERERKSQDPLELMEKSYEMAARYFPRSGGRSGEEHTAFGGTGRQSCRDSSRTCRRECGILPGPASVAGFNSTKLRFCHGGRRRAVCRGQYDTCLRRRGPDGEYRLMAEVQITGTPASGQCACACRHPAFWNGTHRGATDGSQCELDRERRQYPAGGTGGIRHGRQAGLSSPTPRSVPP